MDRQTVAHNEQMSPRYTKLNCRVEIVQRKCLWCDYYFRSTGPAHRKCNHCKRDFGGSPMRIGNRTQLVARALREQDCWGLDVRDLQDEYSNVLHLGIGGDK